MQSPRLLACFVWLCVPVFVDCFERGPCVCLRSLKFGGNLGPVVRQRLSAALASFYSRTLASGLQCCEDCPANLLESDHLQIDLYLGNVSRDTLPKELTLAAATVDGLAGKPEAFVIASSALQVGGGIVGLFADGVRESETHSGVKERGVAIGAVYAAYSIMERLGFTFLHPLEGVVMPIQAPQEAELLNIALQVESPRWPVRGLHYHTQHPLELTDVLQGFDVPMNCSNSCERQDLDGCTVCQEMWADMLPSLVSWFEWSVANRLNRLQWIILGLSRWGALVDSKERQDRFRKICDLMHDFGLACGAVVPVADMQQHGWFMVNTKDPWPKQQQDIRGRIDWIADAGFDFLSTESGLSEFTHPTDSLMLDLLNEFALYTNLTWGKEASVKVHCSTGQLSKSYLDPRPQFEHSDPKPRLNINFLPTLAHPPLGIMPHTVQPFALDDETNHVYGNKNFSDMFDYMMYEAKKGKRKVIWYGETAYWVSVDIDVPLFLPIYARQRVRDLRLIAQGGSIAGQVTFSSGWEWGYWINDVAAARASWTPHAAAKNDSAALNAVLFPSFSAAFGKRVGGALVSWLTKVADEQLQLLLRGNIATFDAAECAADSDSSNSCKAHQEPANDPVAVSPHDMQLASISREQAQELFSSLDGNGDKALLFSEIKQGMARLRQAGAVQGWLWASDLLAGADGDENDYVDEEEFYLMLRIHSSPPAVSRNLTRAETSALFRQLDTGSQRGIMVSRDNAGSANDGRLHFGEIKKGMKALRKAGQVSQKLWASQLLNEADLDGNGFLEEHEFYDALQRRPNRHLLTGLAYLSGWDTWAEIPRLLNVHMTQSDKVLPWDWSNPSYSAVMPLLKTLAARTDRWLLSFKSVKQELELLCGALSASIRRCKTQRKLLEEIEHATAMTKLRAQQVLQIYSALGPGVSAEQKATELSKSRDTLESAAKIVRLQEQSYRVPVARITGWRDRPAPTAYRFGYLYAVSNLYFWWRDQGRAEANSLVARRSPCYLNRMDPTELAFGWSKNTMERLKTIMGGMPRVAGLELGDCLAPPPNGFSFPRDL